MPLAWIAPTIAPAQAPAFVKLAAWVSVFALVLAPGREEQQVAWIARVAWERAALQPVSPWERLALVGWLSEQRSCQLPEAAPLFALAAPLAPAPPIRHQIYAEKPLA
jgi:hypothetical protein